MTGGSTADIQVVVSATGVLDAWIDADGDGTWNQLNEAIVAGMTANPGDGPVTINVPAVGSPLNAFARFRLSHGGCGVGGLASGGEVEDCLVPLGKQIQPGIQLDRSTVPYQIVLHGSAEPGAPSYHVYSSTNLLPTFPNPPNWTLEASGITGLAWSESITVPRKFYVVVAFP